MPHYIVLMGAPEGGDWKYCGEDSGPNPEAVAYDLLIEDEATLEEYVDALNIDLRVIPVVEDEHGEPISYREDDFHA